MEKVLKKKDLPQFLDDLKSNYEVIGPTKKGGGTSRYSHATFGTINRIEDLEIDYQSSLLSPKIIFFPDNQKLYAFKKAENRISLEDTRDIWTRERVLFGLHPCDIAAIECLDKVFQRRDNIKGMRIVHEPPVLRHFTAIFEPF